LGKRHPRGRFSPHLMVRKAHFALEDRHEDPPSRGLVNSRLLLSHCCDLGTGLIGESGVS
jgi:hypothetical protein